MSRLWVRSDNSVYVVHECLYCRVNCRYVALGFPLFSNRVSTK